MSPSTIHNGRVFQSLARAPFSRQTIVGVAIVFVFAAGVASFAQEAQQESKPTEQIADSDCWSSFRNGGSSFVSEEATFPSSWSQQEGISWVIFIQRSYRRMERLDREFTIDRSLGNCAARNQRGFNDEIARSRAVPARLLQSSTNGTASFSHLGLLLQSRDWFFPRTRHKLAAKLPLLACQRNECRHWYRQVLGWLLG